MFEWIRNLALGNQFTIANAQSMCMYIERKTFYIEIQTKG